MSRRKIKTGTHKKKPRGKHAQNLEAWNRKQPLRAAENMRKYNRAIQEQAEAEAQRAAEAAAQQAPADLEEKTECHLCIRQTEYICQTCGLPVCDDCTEPMTVHNQLTETMCKQCYGERGDDA